MTMLVEQDCQAVSKGSPTLGNDEIPGLLTQLHGWQLDDTGKVLTRCFRFKNYYKTIAFVNATAWVSHQQDHHPDLEVGYNRCTVHFTTHSIGGLSLNDFICAARFDALVPGNE